MRRSLHNIHLRRIEWAISSPSLLAYPFCANYFKDGKHEANVMQKLHELDSQSDLINTHFNHLGYMPMGKYFEQLVFFMLRHDLRYEVMLANHQIREGNRTIGELDLIVKDTQTRQREHWEIALKFYLQFDSSPEHHKLIGPNAIDNLGRKMEKLTQRQMPLSNHSSVKYLVGAEKTEPKLFLKGQLFYHLNKPLVLPSNSSPNHEKYWWCYLSEMDEMVSENLKWCVIEKPDWIGIHQTNNSFQHLSANGMKKHLTCYFEKEDKSVLITGMIQTKIGWIEQTRGFVVNNNWPKSNN